MERNSSQQGFPLRAQELPAPRTPRSWLPWTGRRLATERGRLAIQTPAQPDRDDRSTEPAHTPATAEQEHFLARLRCAGL